MPVFAVNHLSHTMARVVSEAEFVERMRLPAHLKQKSIKILTGKSVRYEKSVVPSRGSLWSHVGWSQSPLSQSKDKSPLNTCVASHAAISHGSIHRGRSRLFKVWSRFEDKIILVRGMEIPARFGSKKCSI